VLVTGERMDPERYECVGVTGDVNVQAGLFVFPLGIGDEAACEAVARFGGNIGVGAWT
jgi:hypothetical protein